MVVGAVNAENLKIPFGDLQKMFKSMSEAESEVNIIPPTEAIVDTKRRCVIYKTEEKKIIHMKQN